MKSSLFQKNLLDNDTLLSAVKKAQGKTVVLGSGAEQTILGKTTNNTTRSTIVSQSKIDQVEDRLGYLDRAYFPYTPRENNGSSSTNPRPGGQGNDVDEYETQDENDPLLDAFKNDLDEDLFGDPSKDKQDPQSKGTLSPNEALAQGIQTNQELTEYLKSAHIDVFNGNPQQKQVIDLVRREIAKRSSMGTLTEEEKNNIFYKTWKYIKTNIPSSPTNPNKIPKAGTTVTNALSDEEFKQVLDYFSTVNQLKMRNVAMDLYTSARREGEVVKGDYKQFLENDFTAYSEKAYQEAVRAYSAAILAGTVEIGDFQQFYDQQVVKIYDNCFKPIPVKKKDKVIGSVEIGELIDPLDDSLGATIARYALEKLGTKHGEMDCEQLVKWAIAQVNPDWAKDGIGSGARYQINKLEYRWSAENETDKVSQEDLHTGDLLYWKNNNGEIVHTAIYLNNGYMIESSNTVIVTPFREKTNYGGGEYSYLARVNIIDGNQLNENVLKYKSEPKNP